MIKPSDLLNNLKITIGQYLKGYDDNMNIKYHDEFSNNSHADVDVYLKALPGTITEDAIAYPFQIIVVVDNAYLDFVKEKLLDFTFDYNEKLMDPIDGYENLSIKQFYSTPTILDLFEDSGQNYTTSITIEGRFIIYEDALFMPNSPIFIDGVKLEGVIDTVFSTTHTADAVVKMESPIADNFTNGIQFSLSIDVNLKRTNELHRRLMEESTDIVVYQIKYDNGSVVRNLKTELASLTEQAVLGDITRANIVFRKSGMREG